MSLELHKFKPLLPIVCVVALGLSFWGGMQFQKHLTKTTATASSNSPNSRFGQFGGGQGGGGRFSQRQRPTFGTVSSISGTTMIIKDQQQGTNVTVSLANNPAISDGDGNTVAQSAIKVGDTAAVFGATGSDGTVTASRIRLNPTTNIQPGQQPQPAD